MKKKWRGAPSESTWFQVKCIYRGASQGATNQSKSRKIQHTCGPIKSLQNVATGNSTPQIILVKSQHALETMGFLVLCDQKVSRKLKQPQFLTASLNKSAKNINSNPACFCQPAGIR